MSEEVTGSQAPPDQAQQNEIFQPKPPAQQMQETSKAAGYQIPVDSVTLPSKGILYPVGHALCNEESVEIKCMTAREEDLLTSRALIKNGTVLSKLLSACMVSMSVEPLDMLAGDRNAVLIAIRVTGYGADYSVKITCPDCSEDHDHTFSLGNLRIKTLPELPMQPNVNAFEFTLPMSDMHVEFKLLTGRDEQELSKAQERQKKMLGTQVENNVTGRLLACILAVDGDRDRGKIASIVKNMRAGDARALRNFMDKIEPGVDMKQFAKCPHCGEDSEVEVPLGLNFFWPDVGK